MKLNLLIVSCLFAAAFAVLEDCKGNRDEFEAGNRWGSCDTYRVDHHQSNNFWCDSDMVDGLTADEVCTECGKCRISATQVTYRLEHECTAGNYYGTQYTETDTPTIQDCANLCNDDAQCEFFTYGTQNGYQSATGVTSDGARANDCIFVSNGDFVPGAPKCRWNLYSVQIVTGERSFPFLAWDSHCSLEENNARHYVATKHAFPDSEQACEEFCMDWDECTAFSFKYSDTNDCWAFKQCILEPATARLSASLNQGEYLVTRSFKPFPGPTPQGLKSFPFMAAGSICENHADGNMRDLEEPVSEKACAEFCSDWDECNAYSILIIKQKVVCLAFKDCDSVVDAGFISTVTFQITRLTTPLTPELPEEELFYDEFAFSSCGTRNTQFPGDCADNPLFCLFHMIGTADQCKKECADPNGPNSVDVHGRQCVAFEHSSQDPTEVALCRFAWDCSEIMHWEGGIMYKRTEPSNPTFYKEAGSKQCEAVLNAWCVQNTPYKYARFDVGWNAPNTKGWRCYSSGALTKDTYSADIAAMSVSGNKCPGGGTAGIPEPNESTCWNHWTRDSELKSMLDSPVCGQESSSGNTRRLLRL